MESKKLMLAFILNKHESFLFQLFENYVGILSKNEIGDETSTYLS